MLINKFATIAFTVFIIIAGINIMAAEIWHLQDAGYRLELKNEQADTNGFIDLSTYGLPDDLENGVNVLSYDGKELPFNFYANGGLLIGGGRVATCYVYFGFQQSMPRQRWSKKDGELPLGSQLKLRVFHARWQYLTPGQWFERQRENVARQTRKQTAWVVDYIYLQLAGELLVRYNYPWRMIDRKMLKDSSFFSAGWNEPFDIEDYICWRYQGIYRRSLWNVENYWRKSFANINVYDPVRMEWGIKRLKRILTQQEKNIQQLRKSADTGPERDFINMFEKGRLREDEKVNFDKTIIQKGMVEIRNNYAAVFTGNLVIRKRGEYEFAINVSGGGLLMLDDRIIINRLGENERSIDWQKKIKIKLTRGLHSFKFYYQKNTKLSFACAAWKKGGESEFTPMTVNDFCPGWPIQILQCQDKAGRKYPVVQKTAEYLLYTGKREKMWWNNYKIILGGNADWAVNGKKVCTSENTSIIFPTVGKTEVKISPVDKHYTPLSFIPSSGSQDCRYGRPDIMLKWWMPNFIFDDECVELAVETVSKLPWDTECYLSVIPDFENSAFRSSRELISLSGRDYYNDDDRFIPDSFYKKKFMVNGADIKNLGVKFVLTIPGFTFDEKSVRFVSVRDLGILHTESGELYDKGNNRIIPVLHRPTLAELRSWQLPNLIYKKLSGITQMLIVGDDYGNNNSYFSELFSKALLRQNINTQFSSWLQSTNSSELILLNFIAKLPEIANADTNAILIIPPSRELYDGISARDISRLLAALVEQARNNPGIKRIFITTSLPMINATDQENELNNDIRRIARDYGVTLLDINHFIRKLPAWQSAYVAQHSNISSATILPFQQIPAIVGYLTGEVLE